MELPTLAWRSALVLITLALIAVASPSQVWALVLAVPLVVASLAAHRLQPKAAERWLSNGGLLAADAALIALPLMATLRLPGLPFVGLFGAILLATLLGERRRTVLAAGLLIALAAAWLASIRPALALLQGTEWLYPLLWIAAAGHFGGLSEALTHPREAVVQTRRENRELRALLDIAETIGKTLDVGNVMRTITRLVGDLVGTDSCSILMADPGRDRLWVVASKGHPEVDMLEVRLSDYPEIGRAIDSREPVVINDVAGDPLIAPAREILLDRGYRAVLVLPLLFGDEVLGTLLVRAKRERPFTAEELRFCRVAAGASANALKNALLYREVRHEAREHRRTSEKLRRVLDASPDMIVATNAEGQVVEWNRGAERVTGLAAAPLAGRPLAELLGTPLTPAADPATPQDLNFRRADGQALEISVVGAPLVDDAGRSTGHVWIGRDVTKLRRVERSLAQAERLSSLGEVVAGVAHELNNPLSAVVGYAELLRAHAADPQQLRDLQRIVESALRCQRIVLKLLSFARRHPPEKRWQNLNDCVMKVLDLKGYHLRSSQVRVELQLDPQLPSTSFDFHQLEQVILNLLNNAEHAVTSLRRPGRIVLRTAVEDGSIVLRVEDDGPGVPEAVGDRIFDPFFTTKDVGMGTGLGLSVSYGILREHGGKIELARPQVGTGACFRITLPLVDPPAAEHVSGVAAAPREEPRLVGRRVLIAEDEPMVLELLSRVLEEAGAHVVLAHDGEEAWERLADAGEPFDLIVTDLRMPRLSGQELYLRTAEERPELARRFVFSTGDLAREETMTFLDHVPNRILHKPLEIETLRRVLAQAMVASGDGTEPKA